jgi:hypothetical protein
MISEKWFFLIVGFVISLVGKIVFDWLKNKGNGHNKTIISSLERSGAIDKINEIDTRSEEQSREHVKIVMLLEKICENSERQTVLLQKMVIKLS